MSNLVYIISLVNVIVCLLFLVFQIPRFMDATSKVKSGWITGGEFLLELFKLIAYAGGTVIYLILPCYGECFQSVRKNFNLRYFIFSILLIVMSFIDGSTRQQYHYVMFSFVNLFLSIYVCNVVLKDYENENAIAELRHQRNNSTEMSEVPHFEV